MFVSGEAGIGKSRLVADLVRTAVDEGAAVLVGRCDGTDAAYHPIADALRSSPAVQTVLAESPTAWDSCTGSSAPPARVSRSRFSVTATQRRTPRCARCSPVGRRGAGAPVVEDAEGLDRASARLLRHVAGAPAGTCVVVVYRDPPGGRHPALLELLGDVGLRALTEPIVLGPLDRSATAELVDHLCPLAPKAAARLWEHTGGNPYFAAEMARAETEARHEPDCRRDCARCSP